MSEDKYKKLTLFHDEITKRNYEISSHPINNDDFIVSKDNYYHVVVSQIHIFKAPTDYLIRDIELEFERLESERRGE